MKKSFCTVGRFVLAAVFFLSFAGPAGAQSAASLYEKGLEFQDQDEYFDAIDYYREALGKNASYGDAWFHLAQCYYQLGDFDLALEYTGNAEKFSSSSTEIKNLKGMTLISLGRLNEARDIFEAILKQYPNDLSSRFGLAQLELFNGSLTAAEKKYEDALTRQQYNKTALLSLALISSEMGKNDVAQVYIKKALEAHSGEAQVHYLASYLAARRGDYREAERRARSAVQIKPDYDKAYELLANILYAQKRYEEAVDVCDFRIGRNRNNSDAWYLKGMCNVQLGNLNDAIDVFASGLSISPSDEVMRSALEMLLIENTQVEDNQRASWAQWHVKRAVEYKRNFDSAGERYEYQQALKLEPENKEARQAFADLLNREGFNELYLQQLKFIQQSEEAVYDVQKDENTRKPKKTAQQLKNSDAIESLESAQLTSLAHKWEIDPFYLDKTRWNIGVYYKKTQVQLLHVDSEQLAAMALKEIFSGIPVTSVDVQQKAVSGYAEAYKNARTSGRDYFVILDFDETDRALTLTGEIYSARTGTQCEKITIYRTGNDRFSSALRRFRQSILGVLPIRGKVIRFTGSTALVDLGKSDGVTDKSTFDVVKQGRLYTADKGTGVAYAPEDVIGTLTLNRIDEEISEGKFESKGFYNLLSEKDDVVLVSNSDSGTENGNAAQDTRPQADKDGKPATKRSKLFGKNKEKASSDTTVPAETTLIRLIRSIE